MSENKTKYIAFCKAQKNIRLFSQPWWLDAVAGSENWDVVLVEKKSRIIAALPYTTKKVLIFLIYKMPLLTPWIDIYIDYPDGQKYTTKLGYFKDILNQIIDQLPASPKFFQKYSHDLLNWLPFYWRGFKQTTRYSYVIENLTNLDKVYKDFRENIKREIRKAEKQVTVFESDDITLFYEFNKKTFDRQRKTTPYSFSFIKNLDSILVGKKCRKIFIAKDSEGIIHSAIYIIWDYKCVYYLMGGTDLQYRNSGAASLLMWHSIRFASTVSEQFDFEGSMIESIERFFRAFGATQTPYCAIYKNSHFFKLIEL